MKKIHKKLTLFLSKFLKICATFFAMLQKLHKVFDTSIKSKFSNYFRNRKSILKCDCGFYNIKKVLEKIL